VWHLGAMTDRRARTLKVPLKFLGPGRYAAELLVDDAKAKYVIALIEANVTAADQLPIEPAAPGGGYVKFTRTRQAEVPGREK
jgi:alpha-glucosidase